MATNTRDLKELLDKLIATWENEVVEFKGVGDTYSTDKIGRYFSALANEANLSNAAGGWLVLGVHDKSREAIGTDFRMDPERLNGLKHQIAEGTGPAITFRDIHVLEYRGHRVIMLDIPPAPRGIPVAWHGHFYARDGESLTSLNLSEQDRIRQQTISFDWTAVTVPEAELTQLDDDAVLAARKAFNQRHLGRVDAEAVMSWPVEVFLDKVGLTVNGVLTRAALLLLGKPSSLGYLTPHMAQMTWKLIDKELAYEHFGPPFLLTSTELFGKIRNFQIRMLGPGDSLVKIAINKYDRDVVLEGLHNAIAHQDYTKNARILVEEYPDRLVIESMGSFFDGKPEDYVEGHATPRSYRSPFLAQAMSQLNMIDTLGIGIHQMVERQAKRYLPLPDYQLTNNSVKLTIYGSVVDPAYTRHLIEETDLPFDDILSLDRVQKDLPISEAEVKRLRRRGLVEGRRPHLRVTVLPGGEPAADDPVNMIVSLLKRFGEVTRNRIDELVAEGLGESPSSETLKKKVNAILTKMKRDHLIENVGTRAEPLWRLSSSSKETGDLSKGTPSPSG
ncbi:MAG: putative DNA binding domain-containing protein [Propionibacteriaceae bacterium]|nr:putative DNA binding domain-containing protein [Propionibacteriaceae bacterium]